jgi:hypothetical protein
LQGRFAPAYKPRHVGFAGDAALKRALIGYTGFIGSTLLAANGFTHGFNRQDVAELRGTRFDEIVCAGISGDRAAAERDPAADRAAIATLLAALEVAEAGRFVLISTTEVYADPSQPLDEATDPPAPPEHPFGRHRWEAERFVAARFARHSIVRLPALFGDGLKHNVLFDLLAERRLEAINPAATLQWYPLRRLPGDLGRIAGAGLARANLVSEPVPMRDLLARHFPRLAVGPETAPAEHHALRTRHAPLFGGEPPYVMRTPQVLAALGDFLKAARRKTKEESK